MADGGWTASEAVLFCPTLLEELGLPGWEAGLVAAVGSMTTEFLVLAASALLDLAALELPVGATLELAVPVAALELAGLLAIALGGALAALGLKGE